MRISQETRSPFNIEDVDEGSVFCLSGSLPSRTRCDADDVKKQLRGSDVFKLHLKSTEENGDTYSETMAKPLLSLVTKYIAPTKVVHDLLTVEERGMQVVITNVKEASLNDFTDLYRAKVSATQNVEKTIKDSRALLQRLLNLVFTSSRADMVNVLKHELSPFS